MGAVFQLSQIPLGGRGDGRWRDWPAASSSVSGRSTVCVGCVSGPHCASGRLRRLSLCVASAARRSRGTWGRAAAPLPPCFTKAPHPFTGKKRSSGVAASPVASPWSPRACVLPLFFPVSLTLTEGPPERCCHLVADEKQVFQDSRFKIYFHCKTWGTWN